MENTCRPVGVSTLTFLNEQFSTPSFVEMSTCGHSELTGLRVEIFSKSSRWLKCISMKGKAKNPTGTSPPIPEYAYSTQKSYCPTLFPDVKFFHNWYKFVVKNLVVKYIHYHIDFYPFKKERGSILCEVRSKILQAHTLPSLSEVRIFYSKFLLSTLQKCFTSSTTGTELS